MAIAPLVGLLGGLAVAASTMAAAVKMAVKSHRINKKEILTVEDIATDIMMPEEVVLEWIQAGYLKASVVREGSCEHYEITHDHWIDFIKMFQRGELGKDVANLEDQDAQLLFDDSEYRYNGYEEMALFAKLDEKSRRRLALLDGLSQNEAKIKLSLDRTKLLRENLSLLPEESRDEITRKSDMLVQRVKKLEERNEKIRKRLQEL